MTKIKDDIITHVAYENGITKKEARPIVESVFDFIKDANADGEKVQIIGFGSFMPKHYAAHQRNNPATGKLMDVPESIKPKFTAGKAYKDQLNEK